MEDRPYRVTRHRSSGPSRVAALAGLLVGIVIVGGLVWAAAAAVRSDEEAAAPAPTTVAAETGPPPKPTLKIVFPEGFTRKQMANRITAVNRIAREERGIETSLRRNPYLNATARRPRQQVPRPFRSAEMPHLEGFLFPATYDFTEDTTAPELVTMQLEAFERAWGEVDMAYARSKNLTPYDVLVIASMIEEEVQVPRERALVSAVIYNRLAAGMPLGIDATLRYGLDIPPTESIRQSQLEDDTPYNTRLHLGLPPTPISNPGLAAMEAAAQPADVDYLFFVRNEDCRTHFFTADEDEFYARVAGPRC